MQRLLTRTGTSSSPNLQGNRPILCYYKNITNQLQIARISNISNWTFERVIFPGEQLLFEAVSEAELEIHVGRASGASLADKILCSSLQVRD
ncbi:MAG: DUF1830 domain-containing protein [Coleofasciculus sp. S288]|nr:DUF1830 domain-containing protein [Coleofasciculus sp. S288]